ncbi:phospholipase D1/2, partial [Lecanoromycetidae sp. Uapishka_2]
MNGEPYLVGRFAHTLRMRLMREHLGIDVDEVAEEEEQEEKDQQWEKDMNEFHAKEAEDREAEDQIYDSKSEIKHEILHRSENMSSFNHDVDWEQANNPNLKTNKKMTEDPRVTHNPEHKKDVEGEGPDAMKREEQAGRSGRRDTYLGTIGNGSKEILLNPEDTKAAKGKPAMPSKEPSPPASESRLTEDGGNSGLPPSQTLTRTSTSQLGLSQTSTLPPLPSTDDTDIGGPPPHRSSSQRSDGFINPLVADMKRPFVDKDCMRDPLNDSFFLDTWHAVAENNTKLFRQVFRCMPDNEVKSWKEYKEYAAYTERFFQAQGGGKSQERATQDAPGSSGPPGSVGLPEKLRLLGSVGEKAGQEASKVENLSEKIMQSMGQKDNSHNAQSMGKIEDWAEEANKAQLERQAREGKEKPPSPTAINEPMLDEKAPLRTSNELKIKVPMTLDSEGISKATSPTAVSYSDALNRNTSTQKRRRRATTRSSRREFHASDDIISKADADELMRMVQGHLVAWPYDWLAKEEQGGNWLYSIDGLAPLEI